LGQRCAAFFADFDFLVLPVVQVLPFDVNEPWVKTIQDEPMTTYISWMKSCYMVSALGTPAISIPLTFSDQGLPVGLQIVAPWGQDLRLLQFSKLLEAQISARMIVPRLVSP
jgi:amidase